MATTALSPPAVTIAVAQSLPTGANVAAGRVGITQSGATLTINQATQTAIVNYNSFSIGQGNTVNIVQPNSQSAILNRVTGNTTSTIAGQLNANGQVYLINPNGIAITKSGIVNIGGGFVASTLNMTDSEFLGARKAFSGNGASAEVSNAGTVTIGRGGYAALLGGTVDNSGLITVPVGKIGLGSGEAATLDVSGDGFLQVAVPTAAGDSTALIKSSGTLKANGGSVVITAATARTAARNAVNISGLVEAHSISGHDGAINIGGGDGGAVTISSKVTTSSRRHTGGRITVTGKDIKLASATIDASGKTGGGTVRIGGDLHGTGTLQHADTVTIDAATTIKADAISTGNGGQVVVWSDLLTTFAGTISAKGGLLGGDGGAVETSSAGMLSAGGGTVSAAAPKGKAGTWLLDPTDLVIDQTLATSIDGTLGNGTSVILTTSASDAPTGATLTAGEQNTAGAGDIIVNAPIAWTTNAGLTLPAYNNVTVNQAISLSTGSLTLTANNTNLAGSTAGIAVNAPITVSDAGAVALNAPSTTIGSTTASVLNLAFGSIATGFTGNLTYSGTNATTGAPLGALAINGTSFTLETSLASLATDTAANPTGAFALATNVDGSNGGVGYSAPVISSFSGTLEGLGHTVSNLTITDSVDPNAGFIGTIGSAGTVRDIALVGGSVTGVSYVGALSGQNDGTISAAYSSASVGVIFDTGGGGGGLVGLNNGVITQSYATGTLTALNGANGTLGGLVGNNSTSGLITSSYSTGAVIGNAYTLQIGGLVGYNNGTIDQVFTTGSVTINGPAYAFVGGSLATMILMAVSPMPIKAAP